MKAVSISLSKWRELCADFATQAIYARHANELQRFGEHGRRTCRQDILHHLDYLESALLSNDPVIFTQYALWLKDVLISRGVPASHLGTSFDLLATFFSNNLPADDALEISTVLDSARLALMQDAAPVRYGENRLPALSQTEQYRQSVLHGQHRAAASLMKQAMDDGHTLTQASVRLVQPALYQIGNLWQQNLITVSQEHLATAISQNVLASAYVQATFAPPVGKTAMFACVEGNHHSIGLHMLSDAFETAGWDVLFLGANLPLMDLTREVDKLRPDLLALSISLPNQVVIASRCIGMLHAEMGSACPAIWVGGIPTLGNQDMWRITQADGWACDALHALEQL